MPPISLIPPSVRRVPKQGDVIFQYGPGHEPLLGLVVAPDDLRPEFRVTPRTPLQLVALFAAQDGRNVRLTVHELANEQACLLPGFTLDYARESLRLLCDGVLIPPQAALDPIAAILRA